LSSDVVTSTVKKVPVAIRWSAVVLAVGGLVLWLVLYAPAHFVPAPSEADLRKVDAAKRLELQNDVRGTLLQGLGGLAVLVGAFLAFRQLQTAREGQVTERFTRAIDQLGHENLDVRLGGIYALERIANDSSQDRASVAQVLTAFVRGHAPWPPSRTNQPPSGASILAVPPLRVRAADVQATLTVLGRGKPWMSPSGSLDLRVSDLRRADLAGARLRRANLFSAQLQEAVLMDANLQEANLGDAYLRGHTWPMPNYSRRTCGVPSCRRRTSEAPSCRRRT